MHKRGQETREQELEKENIEHIPDPPIPVLPLAAKKSSWLRERERGREGEREGKREGEREGKREGEREGKREEEEEGKKKRE